MGTLIPFPRIPKHKWSLMDYANLQSAVSRAIHEAEDFHALANSLSLRDRNRVLKRLQADYQDPIYAPWGGLFPHPRVKKEGW